MSGNRQGDRSGSWSDVPPGELAEGGFELLFCLTDDTE